MKQLLKIQLYVNQNPISNEEIVSEKYHIFLDDFSFCKKFYQDTKFFETDLCLKYQNLMKLPIDKLKILVKENKHLICSNCFTKFNKWIKEYENSDYNRILNIFNK